MKLSQTNLDDNGISIKRNDLFGLIFNRFVRINYSDINSVIVVDSVLADGKPPFSGTGSFFNYFPSGLKIKPGEKIFLIERTHGKLKIGFSSNLGSDFIQIFEEKGINITEILN